MRVEVANLTKRFGRTVAVDDFNAVFESGKLIVLLGPSGCGKSTLLYMLAGITPVTSGEIYFNQELVTGLAPENRGVGLVFQNYALYPHMTVMQNICFPLEIQRVPRAERLERARAMAELIHISDLLERKPSELSGGQQQRVAVARALVKEPRLLLLDEPLSNLDARLRIELREEIRRIQHETGVTTIFVTHDQEEAMSIADHLLLMRSGEQLQYSDPQELYDEPVNAFVAEFLGTPPINQLHGLIQGAAFRLLDASSQFQVRGCADIPEGKRVTLAIRPESIFYARDDQEKLFEAEVAQIYRLGKEKLVHLQVGGYDLRSYISRDREFEVGEVIPVGLKDKGVFIFDSSTGERYC